MYANYLYWIEILETIKMYENYLYWIGVLETIKLCKLFVFRITLLAGAAEYADFPSA